MSDPLDDNDGDIGTPVSSEHAAALAKVNALRPGGQEELGELPSGRIAAADHERLEGEPRQQIPLEP